NCGAGGVPGGMSHSREGGNPDNALTRYGWIPVSTGMTTFRLTPKLRQHARGPRQPLDEGAQELAVEAQLAALGEGFEVRRLDLEELHLGNRDDRGGAARTVARE